MATEAKHATAIAETPPARLAIPRVGAVTLAVAAVTALGAIVRFVGLGAQSYWTDEVYSARLASTSLPHMLSTMVHTERTPPLYYVVAWAWGHVLGTGEAQLRSLSALAGAAVVPVAYAIGVRTFSRRAGLVAALLVAVNPLLVWYSQEARAYALLALLGALSLLCLLRAVDDPRAGTYAQWAVASALAVCTHYYAAFLVVPEAAYLLWRGPRTRSAFVAAGSVGAVIVALLPLAVVEGSRNGSSAPGVKPSLLDDRMLKVPKQFLIGFNAPHESAVTGVSLLLCVAAVLLLLVARRDAARRRALLVGALAALGVLLPMAFYQLAGNPDYLRTNYVLYDVVPVVIFVACGFAATRAGTIAAVALAALSLYAVVSVATDQQFQRENWRGAAAALGTATGPRVVIVAPSGPLRYIGLPNTIAYYVPGLRRFPSGGARVAEVAVVVMPDARPAAPLGALERLGFTPTTTTRRQAYEVVRLIAPKPVFLSSHVLATVPVAPPDAGRDVLIER